MPIDSVNRNRIIEPLSLQNTAHGIEADGLAGFVHGYVMVDNELIDVYPWYSSYGVSDGGIQASASDLADFVHGFAATEQVLDDTMRVELFRPSGAGNPPSDYALGIDVAVGDQPDYFVYSHAGKDPGSQSQYIHVSASGRHVTIALCASASFGRYDELFVQALNAVLATLGDAD